jgi:purine-binding chemotaxis protein CheW
VSESGGRALVSVRIGGTWLGVPAASVQEICNLAGYTALPRAPGHIFGLLNLHGQAVALLDLARLLELAADAAAPASDVQRRVVVTTAAGMRVGLIADQVRVLGEVDSEHWREVRAAVGSRLEPFAAAEVDHTVGYVTVLELEKVLEAACIGGEGASR